MRSLVLQLTDEDDGASLEQILETIVESADEPGAELAKLAAYDLDPAVSQHATSLLMMALHEEGILPHAKELIQRSALPVAEQALHDPGLPDDRKYCLGPIFMLCGGQIAPREFPALFHDFEATARRNIQGAFRSLSDQPDGIAEALTTIGLLSDGDAEPNDEAFFSATEMGAEMCEVNTRAAAGILATVVAMAAEHNVAADYADRALDALAETRCERAAWCLRELGRWPAMGPLGVKARALSGGLESQGIAPTYTLECEFSHGLVSHVDGAGTRSVTLFFDARDGELDACTLLVNDIVGMKDAWCSFGNGDEIEAQLGAQDDLVLAPCSPELARELLAEAWAIHEERDVPFLGRFFVCRPYLGAGLIEPSRRTPDLSAYHLDEVECSASMLDGSDELMAHPVYGAFSFTPDAAYDYVAKHASGALRYLSEKELETFVREFAPPGKDILLARIAAGLEVEALAGRAAQALSRLAARTWLGLREGVLPFHEVPYVRALCTHSVAMIAGNLRLGFHSQADADKAALETQQGFRDLLDDSFDEPFG
jgi:hypothetical protein